MSLTETVINAATDFQSALPVLKTVLALIPGDADDRAFAKIEPKLEDAARFFTAHKDQIKPVLAILGLLAARFRHNEANANKPGEPSAPPILPTIPPMVVNVPTPAPQNSSNQATSIDAGVLFVEGVRNGTAIGELADLPRFRRILAGTDAVMLNERVHLNFTPRNSAGLEIPRDVVRALPGNPDGSPALKVRYEVQQADGTWLENSDSASEEDCFELESQNATGHGRDTDNGATPTLKLAREHEGAVKARAWEELPASVNYGHAVRSPYVYFTIN